MKKVSIIGMGALGIMYGAYIKENSADIKLEYVMDSQRFEKYQGKACCVNGREYLFDIKKPDDATVAELLIVAVKYTGLQNALDVMKNCIGEDTVIISVMNGISSEKIIEERYPDAHVVRCIVQGMDTMKLGSEVTYSKMGTVHIGSIGDDKEYVNTVKLFLEKTQIPYVHEDDIRYRMWSKFMLNVGINQTCMAFGAGYGKALEKGEENRVLISAFREAVAVANAEGINLTEDDINFAVRLLSTLRADACPSMAQDRINRKPSEVEMFAGVVIALAGKHGLYVPTNEFLYERIKEIEKEYV